MGFCLSFWRPLAHLREVVGLFIQTTWTHGPYRGRGLVAPDALQPHCPGPSRERREDVRCPGRCAAAGSEDRGITHAHDHPLARAAACHAVESMRRRSSQQPNQCQVTAGVVVTPACKGILMDQVTRALTRRRCLTSLTLRCRSTAPCHGLGWAPGNPYPCPVQNHHMHCRWGDGHPSRRRSPPRT